HPQVSRGVKAGSFCSFEPVEGSASAVAAVLRFPPVSARLPLWRNLSNGVPPLLDPRVHAETPDHARWPEGAGNPAGQRNVRFVVSKQYPEREINLVGRSATAIDGESAETSKFRRKNQIRSRAEHHVA